MTNIHQRIGWFNCANLRCRRELGVDHVTVTTTAHLRRFCSVYCVAEGLEAWTEHLGSVPNGPEREDLTTEYQEWSQRVFEAIPPATPPCAKCGTPVGPNQRLCADCGRITAQEIVVRAFAEEQMRMLSTLPKCPRCEAVGTDGETRCEKCLDCGWQVANLEPLTCGCGCHTRWSLEIELGLSSPPQLEGS